MVLYGSRRLWEASNVESTANATGLIHPFDRFMAASKVLGEETIAGSGAQQQQQTNIGNSDT